MCGRYSLYETKDITTRFSVSPKSPQLNLTLHDNYNVAPGQIMTVITIQDGARTVELMKWGLVPHWAKNIKIGYKLINARAETAFSRPMWRAAIRNHRCLVPARGFYEWRKTGATTKQPFYIHPTDQKLFAFAGLYCLWRDTDGQPLMTYSILTTEPNHEMSSVHDRMPVILRPQDESSWLDPTHTNQVDLEHLLTPYHDGRLELYPVSADVNTPKVNDAHLMQEIHADSRA